MKIGTGIGIPSQLSVPLSSQVAALFQSGEQGVWYDPSDLSTMFQDAAGTTPVTAVEQPVGLILDKRIQQSWIDVTGAVWTKTAGDGVVTVSGNQITVTGATTLTTVTRTAGSIPFTAGTARISIRADWTTATGISLWLRGYPYVLTNGVTQTRRQALNNSALERLDVATGTVTFTILDFDYWAGNHATQTTTTSRPVLSARYNLLTRTEEFDDAVWSKFNGAVSANSTLAPNGTQTADLFTENTVNGAHMVRAVSVNFANNQYRFSVYIKPNGRNLVAVVLETSTFTTFGRIFDLATGTSTANFGSAPASHSIQALDNGWFLLTIENTQQIKDVGIVLVQSGTTTSYAGDGTSGIYIWGADLRVANDGANLPPYQRVNTATDYDSNPALFPYYLLFDQTDDALSAAGFNLTGTDKVTVGAAIRKQSDSAQGIVVELGAGTNTNRIALSAPGSAAANYAFTTGGTTSVTATTGNSFAAPRTEVLTGIGDIASDTALLRVNGVQQATSASDQGTGTYMNGTLFIGRRNNASLPFGGRLYGLIVRGASNTAAQTAAMERYLASKSGVTL